jgi:hypothetical protein
MIDFFTWFVVVVVGCTTRYYIHKLMTFEACEHLVVVNCGMASSDFC